MLKDRRVLIEHDLALVKEEAAKLYLQIVIDGGADLLFLSRYEEVRSKIANLQLDLTVINDLIERGQE